MTERERRRPRFARPTILGPVFTVELVRAARRGRLYTIRALYALALLAVVAIGVSAMDYASYGAVRQVNSIEQAARFTERFIPAFGLFQLAAGTLLVAAAASGTIADERQRRTLEFLFATDLSNRELVLGKFAVVMLSSIALLASAAPVVALAQLYGATPIDELARSTIVAVSTMAFVAAGCLLVSVLSTRPREAVVRAFVVATFLLLGPLLLIFLMIYRPDLYEWIQPLHEFALDANPLVYWVRTTWPASGGYLPTLSGWPGVANLVWNQALMTAVFLGWAILRVRAVYLKSANRPAFIMEKPAKKFSWRTMLRPSLNVLPPMLWKELFLQSTIRGMNRRGKVIACLVDASLFAVLGWYWYRCFVAKESSMARSGFAEAMSYLSLAVTWVYLLVSATRAATSMTVERESGHWESLLATRLSGADIVIGKTLGATLSLRLLLVHVLVFYAMAAAFYPEIWWHGLRMCLTILLAAFVVAAVGVLCSIRAVKSARAVLNTIAVGAVLSGLYMIPFPFAPRWYQQSLGNSAWYGILRDASFMQSTAWAAFAGGPSRMGWDYRLPTWNGTGLAIQFALGLAVMGVAAGKFDRWTGRAARRPK